MCLIYLKYSDVISDIKALKEETTTGKDFEDQAISTLALLHYWLRYWSKNTATALPSRKQLLQKEVQTVQNLQLIT